MVDATRAMLDEVQAPLQLPAVAPLRSCRTRRSVLAVPPQSSFVTMLSALSQLMGKERNVPLQERSNKKLHFYDKVHHGIRASCWPHYFAARKEIFHKHDVLVLILEPVGNAPQDICKYRIAGLCPYQLFTNTCSYLGACASACSPAPLRLNSLQNNSTRLVLQTCICWITCCVSMPPVRRSCLHHTLSASAVPCLAV